MIQCCFVCDIRVGITTRQAVNIFTETISRETTVASLLSLVLERAITKDNVHSEVICKKCHKHCIEYQLMHLKLREAKGHLQSSFRSTLAAKKKADSNKNSTKSATMPVLVKEETVHSTAPINPLKPMVRLVLPASRLQPLPANYVLNVDPLSAGPIRLKSGPIKLNTRSMSFRMVSLSPAHKMPKTFPSPVKIAPYPSQRTPTKNIITTVTSSMHKPVTGAETKASSPSEKASSSAITEPNSMTISRANTLNSYANNQPSIVSYNVNMLPNNLFSGAKGQVKVEDELTDELSNDTNDERAMEIDEDSSSVRVPASTDSDLMIDEGPEKDTETSGDFESVDVSTVAAKDDGSAVSDDVEQAQDNDSDDDHQTIVMEDENGSILQMVSGQKFYSTCRDLSLLMPSDQEGEGNDSNDESQIELQVSGDEETAQAIIAAAQEQGGAFIKVESGEMFRVKSVKSQTADEADETNVLEMVKEENGKFVCLLCNNAGKDGEVQEQTVAHAEEMMQHLKERHNARLYICWVCNCLLRRRADLTKHLSKHEETKGALVIDRNRHYACNMCDKKYNSKTILQEHLNMHSGKRPYVCVVCGKSFASKYTHQAHLKTHSERPRPFRCEQCPKAFLNYQNLAQHEKTHLGIKDFVCNVCSKAFATQHNLEVHRVVHLGTKPYTCDTCGKGFARRNEVKDHVRIHTGERPFRCDICGAAFAQRSNLATHKRATHLNEARYSCKQCPKRFKRRRLLDYHIKSSHTGERPLVCEICNSTFVYPEHFRKHQRIHSGEKPYDCEVCGKTFNSRDNRNTHRFVHSDKKPYECLVCGAGYMRKQLLYAHMNTSSHLAESIVVNQPRVQKVSTRDKIVFESRAVEIHENSGDKTEGEVTKIYLTSTTNDGKYVLQDGAGHDRNLKKVTQKDKYKETNFTFTSKYQGKSVINLEVEGDESALLSFLHNIDPNGAKPTSQGVTTEQLAGEQVQMVSTEEVPILPNVRLVQVQMQDGAMGWVAVGD